MVLWKKLESWRDGEWLFQYLFGALFYTTQSDSAINLKYLTVSADPSCHRATVEHWHSSQSAD